VIVLDTNVLPSGPAAGSVVFPILTAMAHHAREEIAVPRIAVEESCSRLDRELSEAFDFINRGLDIERKYIATNFTPLPVNEHVVPKWRTELERRFTVLPIPAGAAEEGLLREARRQPPAHSGRGARDTVIWLTALDVHREGDSRTYFVSANTKDFGRGGLIPELRAEVVRESDFVYCESLQALLDHLAARVSPPLRLSELRASEVVTRAITRNLTGSSWFFEILRLAPLPWGQKSLAAGPVEVELLTVEDVASYRIDDLRFSGVRLGCRSNHHIDMRSIAEDDLPEQDYSAVFESSVTLLLRQDNDGAISEAQVVYQSPLTRPTSSTIAPDRPMQ
jgi:hypothetical protein